MAKRTHYRCIFIAALLPLLLLTAHVKAETKNMTPPLTVVIIADSFGSQYLPKLRKHFRYGLKTLFDQGIVYTHAYHPHAIPETTPGHNALSTGTLPKDHGAVLNQWLDQDGKKVAYEDDDHPKAAVITDAQAYKDGKSSRNTAVDSLSDQFIFQSTTHTQYKAFALALKSYPALSCATRMGKAIWFDPHAGQFTSTTDYFQTLPDWLTTFNKKANFAKAKKKKWKTVYGRRHEAYQFPFIDNYDYAGFTFSLAHEKSIDVQSHKPRSPYELFLKTPIAGQKLFDLAQACVRANLVKQNDRMLLWISLSNLDLVAHIYGPDSLEVIDTIYHIDKQIQEFMTFCQRKVGLQRCLFVFTADHGMCPIPELMHKRGYTQARRLLGPELVKQLNEHIEYIMGIKDIVVGFEPTYFRLDDDAFIALTKQDQEKLLNELKAKLGEMEGIKRVWTKDELADRHCKQHQAERFYQTQMYKDRMGDIICQPQPYCQLTNYPTGTAHLSPYRYDTQVPIVVYQKGKYENKTVNEKVWSPQLPVTLAKLMHISTPSASTYSPLPELWQ
ncbi:MAG: alkaline phosphatase family protein [Epsilonproteobacteria bacterium]|nr:alkaline phosphatase family protein [Campylobacterota bacterium]